jgi:hypothetical protein
VIYVTTPQPVSNASQGLAQERKSQLRAIQAARPAADGRSIGHAVRVFECRHRVFPRAVFHKAPSQCLTPRQQAVMRVRERKHWEESEGLPANWAATATDANPIVILIVRLLAAAAVADDRIPFTCRASPQDLVAVSGPISFKLVRQRRKWDKKNRSSLGLCHRR